MAHTEAEYKQMLQEAEQKQDLKQTLSIYEEYLANFEDIAEDINKKPEVLINYALMLSYSGQYNKSIDVIIEALDLTENDPSQKEARARAFMQFGLIHFFMEQYDEALVHYQRADKLAQELDNELGMSIAKNNIGNIFQKKEKYAQAIEYYQESLLIQKNVNDSATIANTLFNIGTCYEELGNITDAVQHLEHALEMATVINDKEIMPLARIKLGILNEDITLIEQGIGSVEQSGHQQVLLEAYNTYARLLAEQNQYIEAYNTLQKSIALSHSIFKEDALEMLNEFSVKYETKEQEARHKVQVTILLSLTALCLFIIITLVFVIRIHRRINKKLKDINTLKDKFVGIISHDIKNPLTTQKTILELVVDNFESIPPDELKTQCTSLLDSSHSLLDMLHNLLNWSQIESKTIKFNPTRIDVVAIIGDTKEIFKPTLQQKNIEVQLSAPDTVHAYGDYNMLATVIRNILNNAIKYSHSNSNIDINISATDRKWDIAIKDSGVGISEQVRNTLFKLTSVKSKLGTRGESGSGFGLIITKEMIQMNQGDIAVESTEGIGTTITFTIPKYDENHKNNNC